MWLGREGKEHLLVVGDESNSIRWGFHILEFQLNESLLFFISLRQNTSLCAQLNFPDFGCPGAQPQGQKHDCITISNCQGTHLDDILDDIFLTHTLTNPWE